MRLFWRKSALGFKKYSKREEIQKLLVGYENNSDKMLATFKLGLQSLQNLDYSNGNEFLTIAKELSTELKDQEAYNNIVMSLLEVNINLKDYQKVIDLAKTITFDQIKDSERYTQVLILKGRAYASLQQSSQAEDVLSSALQTGSEAQKVRIYDIFGTIKLSQGEIEEAKRCFQECNKISKKLGNRFFEAKSLATIGSIVRDTDVEKGTKILKDALKISQEIKDKHLEENIQTLFSEIPIINVYNSTMEEATLKLSNFELLESKKLFEKGYQMCKEHSELQPKYKDTLNRYIYSLITNYEFEEAEKLLQYATELAGDNKNDLFHTFLLLGWLYFYRKDYNAAKKTFEKLKESSDEFAVFAYNGLSSISLMEGEYKKTKDLIKEGMKFPNSTFQSVFEERLGLNEVLNGDFSKAKSIYSNLSKNNPYFDWKLKIAILDQTFEKKEWKELFIQAESKIAVFQVKEFINIIDELVNMLPDTKILKYYLKYYASIKKPGVGLSQDLGKYLNNIFEESEKYMKEKNYLMSKNYLKILIEHESFIDQKNKSNYINILSRFTYCLFQLGDFQEELRNLEAFNIICRDHGDEEDKAEALFRLGICHKNLQNYSKAEDYLIQVININIKNLEFDSLYELSKVYALMNDSIRFHATMSKYIDLATSQNRIEKIENGKKMLKANEVFYHFHMGIQEAKNEKLEKAEEHFDKMFSLDIGNDRLHIDALFYSADLLMKMGKMEKCESQLMKCQELIDKNHLQSHYGFKIYTSFGYLYLSIEKFHKSIEYFEKTLLLPNEKLDHVYGTLGYLYLYILNYENSKYFCEKALQGNYEPESMVKNLIINRILARDFMNARKYIQNSKDEFDKSYYSLIIEEMENQPKNEVFNQCFEKLMTDCRLRDQDSIQFLTKFQNQAQGKELKERIQQVINKIK